MDAVPGVDAAQAFGTWARARPLARRLFQHPGHQGFGPWARTRPGKGITLLLFAVVLWLLVAGASRPCQAAGEAMVRGGTVTFPPFEVNIDDGGTIGRLRLAFEVLFSDEQGAKMAASGQVREDMLLFFRDKTAAQLLAPRGRDALRAQLLQLINASLGGPKAIRLYFLDYLVLKAERP